MSVVWDILQCKLVTCLQSCFSSLEYLPKVHVQVTVEDAVRLRRVEVPNELTIGKRSRWGHHLRGGQPPWPVSTPSSPFSAYAINPFWVEQRLVVVRRLVEPLPLHVKEITSLQRNGTDAADFIGADGACQGDLASH